MLYAIWGKVTSAEIKCISTYLQKIKPMHQCVKLFTHAVLMSSMALVSTQKFHFGNHNPKYKCTLEVGLSVVNQLLHYYKTLIYKVNIVISSLVLA